MLNYSVLNSDLLDTEAMEDTVSLIIDSVQRVMDVLVLLKWFFDVSGKVNTRFNSIEVQLASTHPRWIKMGRIGSQEIS